MKKLLLSAIVLIPAAGIMAQEKAIDEVVIDGKFLSLPYKKVSENIEIITKEQIEKAPAQSIGRSFSLLYRGRCQKKRYGRYSGRC